MDLIERIDRPTCGRRATAEVFAAPFDRGPIAEYLDRAYRGRLEVAASLRPGGILRLSVPNGSNVLGLLAAPDWTAPKNSPSSLNPIAPLEHLNCFDHQSLVQLAVAGGLEEFRYPTRQYLGQFTRERFALSALAHVVRPPRGTMLLFRKSSG